jgi:hypothetical protein
MAQSKHNVITVQLSYCKSAQTAVGGIDPCFRLSNCFKGISKEVAIPPAIVKSSEEEVRSAQWYCDHN